MYGVSNRAANGLRAEGSRLRTMSRTAGFTTMVLKAQMFGLHDESVSGAFSHSLSVFGLSMFLSVQASCMPSKLFLLTSNSENPSSIPKTPATNASRCMSVSQVYESPYFPVVDSCMRVSKVM